ncbi:hypothetical protein L843_5333 [Mycobacterium intracellulare MIN_061107_1834]|nr:hypothetical protein L843_5333 [Mycobacterium intracellulare MIN_061107_1834]
MPDGGGGPADVAWSVPRVVQPSDSPTDPSMPAPAATRPNARRDMPVTRVGIPAPHHLNTH